MLPYFIKFETDEYAGHGFGNASVWYVDREAKTMQWVNAGAEGTLKEIFKDIYGAEIGYVKVKSKYPVHVRCMQLHNLKVLPNQLRW